MDKSLQGQFLIAGKRLRDPNFYQSVVLIVEHGSHGAMGLVVNRPSSVKVTKALAEHFTLPESDDRVFVGGPVEPSALFILHNTERFDQQARDVAPGVYVGSSAEVFENVVRAASDGEASVKYRILCGCAGWGPGQLESELSRADWRVRPASAELVFHDDPYETWQMTLKEAFEADRILPDVNGNPELN